jgi:glycosyltransferase involved in cell wall biosynthesis
MVKRKILIVYNEDFPWDIRVEKFCKSYIFDNYDVFVLCNNKKNSNLHEKYEGINIIRIWEGKPDFFKIPAFFNPIWLYKIYKIIKKYKIDLILIRDLPLALAGIVIGKICKVPTIYDMAENYPEAIKIWKKTGDYKSFTGKIIRNYLMFKIIEKISCKYADLIFVVIEENLERLKILGIPSSKIKVIENTPDLKKLPISKIDKLRKEKFFKQKFVLTYVGGFQFHRGILDVIIGMETIIRENSNILLILVGDGPQRTIYENEVAKRKLSKNVVFLGFVKWPNIYDYILLSDLCLIPHLKSGHTDTTMPNKIYDYISLKKPVLVSDAVPLKRFVLNEKCGVFFESGNIPDFSKKVIELYNDKKILEDMGENGFKAVVNKYNWKNTSKNLLMHTNLLLEKKTS